MIPKGAYFCFIPPRGPNPVIWGSVEDHPEEIEEGMRFCLLKIGEDPLVGCFFPVRFITAVISHKEIAEACARDWPEDPIEAWDIILKTHH
jgi:hypothetical protein